MCSKRFKIVEIRKILEYEWKKIIIKTTFKSILENRIRKNMNFGKRFPKNMRAKLEFQGCLKKYGGGEKRKIHSGLGEFPGSIKPTIKVLLGLETAPISQSN
jgi:hypothetical protein